jgi:hypothetical protein
LDVVFLLSRFQREVARVACILDAFTNRRLLPPRRKKSGHSLSFADEFPECWFRGRLIVVDGAIHNVSLEVVHIFLAHTQTVDQELESLLLRAAVEKTIVGDGREGLLVLAAILEGVVIRIGRGLLACRDRSARLLVGSPVSFLTVFVAVRNRLATSTLQERDVDSGTGRTGTRTGHLDV